MLGLVDHDDGVGVERDEGAEEALERRDELMAIDRAAASRLGGRHESEVDQDLLQQVLDAKLRVEHDGQERPRLELLEQRAAQHGLADADVAGDDDQAFAAAEGEPDVLDRPGVRSAVVDEARIGRQAEGRRGEAVVRFGRRQHRRERETRHARARLGCRDFRQATRSWRIDQRSCALT
jgi:hypothetical protein